MFHVPQESGCHNTAHKCNLHSGFINSKEVCHQVDDFASGALTKEAAKLFEISSLDQRYQEYSSGNKSRLALARSFLIDAPILFMDEPTKGLDPNARGRTR